MLKRATIHDVARKAGVSYQTVSRVMNNRPDVAEETRQRVLISIQELGFRPNAVARSLVTQRTHLMGLVTIDYEDPFFAGVCSGVQEEAHRRGYMLMITSTDRDISLECDYVHSLREHQVEGIIMIRHSILNPGCDTLGSFVQGKDPFVVTSIRYPGENCVLVDIDNVDGSKQAVQHLIENGHRQIAMITAPSSYLVTFHRNQGYLEAHHDAGLQPDPALTIEADWLFSGGYRAAWELLGRGIPFSAIFCHNDLMTFGAIRALREAGKKIPEEVSIIGYDDLPACEYIDPPLTSVWQPRYEMGATVVKSLIAQIEGDQIGQSQDILLKPRLVLRGSVQAYNTISMGKGGQIN